MQDTPQQLVGNSENNLVTKGKKSHRLRVNKANCEIVVNSRDRLAGKKNTNLGLL